MAAVLMGTVAIRVRILINCCLTMVNKLPFWTVTVPEISDWWAAETLYHRDDALVYIAHVMLIWAASISADRWHCSMWP